MKRRQNNEAQLEKELGRFFKRLKKSVLKGLDEYWSDYQLLQGQVNLMLSPIHEAHKEYYEIIKKYKLREYQLGKAEAKRLTKRANKDKVALKAVTTLGIQGFIDKDKNNLFGTIPQAEQDLLNRTFRTSQNTLNRVDNQLNRIISDGYREGKGINKVANDITQRFDQLADWEARRIARTEINTSHNQATRDQYKEDGVEYTQWIAAGDDRTRDSHVDVDGEIIPIEGKYSNGLAFPGDTSGPIEEWINCRCSNAPFVVPYGFMAPSFSPFRESDLVPINMESLGEPSPEQLEANLSPEQRSQYEQYTKAVNEAQAVIDSKFSLPRERLQARTQLEYNLSKLNQLKLVANGELARGYQGIIGAVASQPETPTDDQIKQNLTRKEQKQLEGFQEQIRESKEWLRNNPEATAKQKEAINTEIKQKTIKINKLKEKALGKTTEPTSKAPIKPVEQSPETPVENTRKTIKDLHSDVKMPTEELIPTLQEWAKKRLKNKKEYGYQFDITTGKLITEEITGKRGGVTFKENGRNIGSVHTHPPEQDSVGGGAFPSPQDIKTYRAQAGTDHFVISPREIWYIYAEEELGLQQAQFFTQREIDKTFEKIYKDVEKEGKELVKKGELKTDNESMRMFLDEEIGNRIINEFSKPEWREKGFIIERYYYD